MAKLSLKDVARLTDDLRGEDLITNPDMNDYVMEMQEVGGNVLKNLSSEELAVAVSFMEAMFTYTLLQKNPMLFMMVTNDLSSIGLAMTQALKFVVGISLSEDWR